MFIITSVFSIQYTVIILQIVKVVYIELYIIQYT
jgi:hypothetical protein